MFVRLTQATTITLVLYILLGLNSLQNRSANQQVEPAEALVAFKQALIRR